MLFVIRQRVRAAGQSLAGDGMLLRLRNASIALVAAVTAVGLGLTLFIAQLGFPGGFSSPIPGNPTEAGTVHAGIALTHSPVAATAPRALGGRSRAGVAAHARRAGGPGNAGGNGKGSDKGGGLGGSRQVAVSPGAPQDSPAQQPAPSVPVSASPAPAPTPSPSPVTAAVGSPSKSASDGQSKGTSGGTTKSNAPSTAKAVSDSGGKAKGPQTAKSDGNTAAVGGKSNDTPAEKAGKDQSAAATPAAPPTAAPASQPVSPAAAKEAADSGK